MLGENSQVATPKMWKDLSTDEKFERMRQEIKGLQSYIGNLQSNIHQIRTNFAKHEHSNGKIMTPHEAFGSNVLSGTASNALHNLKAEAEGSVYF